MARITLGGLSSGMDTDNMIKELMKAHSMKSHRYKKRNIMNDYKQDEWKKLNAKIYSFYNKDLTNMRLKGNIIKHKISISKPEVVDISASPSALKGNHEIEVLRLAQNARANSGKIQVSGGNPLKETTTMDELGLTGKELKIAYQGENGPEEITIVAEEKDTLAAFARKIRDKTSGKIDVEANADINNGYLFLATKKTGEKQSFRLFGDVATALGFSATENKGVNAEYRYNGMEIFTSESNQVEVNGMKATLKSVGKTSINIDKDVDAAYKQIVDFFKKYNVLAKELQDKESVVIQRSQRDMEPLLDEEKKAMSEADVKKWEETLRGRVFKGDRNIRKILQDMKSTMTTTTIENNGSYNALGSLGIKTGEFKEGTGAMLFIEGDSELGGKRADMPNKLREALEKDPEAVAELISKISNELSEKFAKKMKGTSLRTYMNFYDDKALKEENRQLDTRIRTMEAQLTALEERYRKQFAAMEKALAKSNSTASWLSQQFSKM